MMKYISPKEQRDPTKKWNKYKIGDKLVCKVHYPNIRLYKNKVYTISYVDIFRIVFGNYNDPDCCCEPYKVYGIFYEESDKKLRKLKLDEIHRKNRTF